MRCEIYHFSTSDPFVALCGARGAPERNGHALTSRRDAITCPDCKRLRAEAQIRAQEPPTVCETAEAPEVVRTSLRVSWK